MNVQLIGIWRIKDFTAFNSGNGTAESWLISYTQQLRKQLPQGQYILSHARGLFIIKRVVAIDQNLRSRRAMVSTIAGLAMALD